jgi:hypothetical protein
MRWLKRGPSASKTQVQRNFQLVQGGPCGPAGPSRPTPYEARVTARVPQVMGVVRARVLDARRLAQEDLQAWLALEARVLEPNLNLSPHFVLPALRHLDPKLAVYLHVAEQAQPGGGWQFIGLALVHAQGPDRLFVLPHLSSYHCDHAFLGHWLLDRDQPVPAAVALLQQMRQRHRWAAALTLPSSPAEGPQLAVMRAAASQVGLHLAVMGIKERAVLVPAQAGDALLKEPFLRKQKSNLDRCRRRLEERGALEWRCLRDALPASAVEDFLRLEHSGWKRESGTSLRSRPGDEAFFREMTQGFASEGRALFTELRLNGEVIASTCNYISGDIGYAFKVGWEEAYRKYGIGIYNEAELVRQAPQLCADLKYIDSGSQPASFIEMLWPGRRQVATLVLPMGPVGHWAWQIRRVVMQWARHLRPGCTAPVEEA